MTIAPRLFVITALLLLSACSDDKPQALFDDYRQRLERLSGINAADTDPLPRPEYPGRRALIHILESPDINWRELWNYRACGLAQLLGERNSILGKHMAASTHFVMDARILATLKGCIDAIDDAELKTLTRELIAIKRAQLPRRYANASVASEEMQTFWSYAGAPLSTTTGKSLQTVSALDAWRQAGDSATDKVPDLRALERANGQLNGRQGGQLLKSLLLAEQQLRRANQLLRRAGENRVFCPLGSPTKQLQWARNVMEKFFIGQVQPYIARLNGKNLQLRDAFAELVLSQPPTTQTELAPFMKQWQQLSDSFLRTTRAHVTRWQTLFRRCQSRAVELPEPDNR